MDISEIDKNFALNSFEKDGMTFYDADSEPFKVYGVMREDGIYRRMPKSVSQSVSKSVDELSLHTAGGRVRFITDSNEIAIKAEMHAIGKMSHFALSGSAGFDVYSRDTDDTHGQERFLGSFIPPFDISDGYESRITFDGKGKRLITLNFPLYSGVKKLFIGLKSGSAVLPSPEYSFELPVVYYGSSITQGGCASRPGTSYQGFLSAWLNIDYINLGFSGSALAEKNMADYIASLPMSAFVYDYDHNAPTIEHLTATHYPFYKIVRESHPSVPIICMSKPLIRPDTDPTDSAEVIKETVKRARSEGDKNIYFISGETLFDGDAMSCCTVDGTHPTDLGFYRMAKALEPTLRNVLKIK